MSNVTKIISINEQTRYDLTAPRNVLARIGMTRSFQKFTDLQIYARKQALTETCIPRA
jgi:hypothetical protein